MRFRVVVTCHSCVATVGPVFHARALDLDIDVTLKGKRLRKNVSLLDCFLLLIFQGGGVIGREQQAKGADKWQVFFSIRPFFGFFLVQMALRI